MPAPAPVPAPVPAPAPAPTPAPTPVPPTLATGAFVWSNKAGDGELEGRQVRNEFNAAGDLVKVKDASSGKTLFDKGTPTNAGVDGDLAWGRWIGGNVKLKGSGDDDDDDDADSGKLVTFHYMVAGSAPTGATSGGFTSFASTAPTVHSNGKLVATGTANGAGGSFTAALTLAGSGSASYTLTVPVSGQTFTLTGTAAQTSLSTFAGVSVITSTGTGCQSGCRGSLGNNVSVIGQISGTQGTHAGVLYGFDSRLGNVSGVIVFKR